MSDVGSREAVNATFCTVSSAHAFVGTVGLLNSLRLTGHSHELIVLDMGLSEEQRAMLELHCRIVDPAARQTNPLLLKPFPAILGLQGVVVIVDSDVIVTAHVGPWLSRAAAGVVLAIPDTDRARFFPEWQQLYGLTATLTKQPYLNTAFVLMDAARWKGLLDRWWSISATIEPEATLAYGAEYGSPLADGDQDVFNALLMSEFRDTPLEVLPPEVGPLSPWNHPRLDEVEVEDAERLVCRFEETPTVFLHHAGRKPWLSPLVNRNAYSFLLPRVLFADDVLLRLDPSDVPFWIRPTRGASTVTGAIRQTAPVLRRGLYAARSVFR